MDALPEGWEETQDPSSGKVYYYNSQTNQTQWHRPTEAQLAEAQLAEVVATMVDSDSDAAKKNKLQTMERLLAEGASADAKRVLPGEYCPALVLAAMDGHLDALKLLHKHGANLEATNSDGETALMWAAQNDHADCAEALLEWGADKDAGDSVGETALHRAAQYGLLEIARLLVRAGADRTLGDPTALELARQVGHMKAAEVAALLERADADVSDSAPFPILTMCSRCVFGLRRMRSPSRRQTCRPRRRSWPRPRRPTSSRQWSG